MRFSELLSGLFHAKAKRESPGAGGSAPPSPSPRYGSRGLWDMPLTSAMSVSTVFCCVGLLSDSVANLPVRCLRQRGGIFTPDGGGRLGYLLNVQPDVGMSAFDFWRQVVIEVLLSGNAYIIPGYSAEAGDYVRLALCRRGSVSHDTLTDTYTVSDVTNGIYGKFGEGEVIHIKGMPGHDPKHGLSVLSYARQSTNIAQTSDRETLDRFENGGTVRGLVSNGDMVQGYGELQDRELRKTATDLDSRFRSGERIVALPREVGWHQLSMSSADMQFLESRKFTVREICRFFRVHPSFVFDDTSNNYKSAEMANVAFLSNTLNPILRKIENELLRKLYPESLCMKRRIEFDRAGLYACDLDSRVKYQAQMIAAGLYTVNECRAMENRPPVEGGDKVLVSANLKGIDELQTPAPQRGTAPDGQPEADK